jgi:hypothetical protein
MLLNFQIENRERTGSTAAPKLSPRTVVFPLRSVILLKVLTLNWGTWGPVRLGRSTSPQLILRIPGDNYNA